MNRPAIHFGLGFVMLICLSVRASAQSTRPSPAWERAVLSLGSASSRDGVQALLSPHCAIHRFGGERDANVDPLLEFISSHIALGAHAYLFPPDSMASDIAADVNASALVSAEVKQAMTPDGPEARKNAAVIAARWVRQTLDVEEGSPVGIILFWPSSSDQSFQKRVTFILLRGKADGDDFRISGIVYGDPLQ